MAHDGTQYGGDDGYMYRVQMEMGQQHQGMVSSHTSGLEGYQFPSSTSGAQHGQQQQVVWPPSQLAYPNTNYSTFDNNMASGMSALPERPATPNQQQRPSSSSSSSPQRSPPNAGPTTRGRTRSQTRINAAVAAAAATVTASGPQMQGAMSPPPVPVPYRSSSASRTSAKEGVLYRAGASGQGVVTRRRAKQTGGMEPVVEEVKPPRMNRRPPVEVPPTSQSPQEHTFLASPFPNLSPSKHSTPPNSGNRRTHRQSQSSSSFSSLLTPSSRHLTPSTSTPDLSLSSSYSLSPHPRSPNSEVHATWPPAANDVDAGTQAQLQQPNRVQSSHANWGHHHKYAETQEASMEPRQPTSPSALSSPLNPRQPKKKAKLTNQLRREMLKYAEDHPVSTQVEIANKFDVERSTVSKTLKNAQKIVKECEEGRVATAKHRPTKYPDVEESMLPWVRECVAKEISITDSSIKEKALEIAGQLGHIPKFKASVGWVSGFKQRNNIRRGAIFVPESHDDDEFPEGSASHDYREQTADDAYSQRFAHQEDVDEVEQGYHQRYAHAQDSDEAMDLEDGAKAYDSDMRPESQATNAAELSAFSQPPTRADDVEEDGEEEDMMESKPADDAGEPEVETRGFSMAASPTPDDSGYAAHESVTTGDVTTGFSMTASARHAAAFAIATRARAASGGNGGITSRPSKHETNGELYQYNPHLQYPGQNLFDIPRDQHAYAHATVEDEQMGENNTDGNEGDAYRESNTSLAYPPQEHMNERNHFRSGSGHRAFARSVSDSHLDMVPLSPSHAQVQDGNGNWLSHTPSDGQSGPFQSDSSQLMLYAPPSSIGSQQSAPSTPLNDRQTSFKLYVPSTDTIMEEDDMSAHDDSQHGSYGATFNQGQLSSPFSLSSSSGMMNYPQSTMMGYSQSPQQQLTPTPDHATGSSSTHPFSTTPGHHSLSDMAGTTTQMGRAPKLQRARSHSDVIPGASMPRHFQHESHMVGFFPNGQLDQSLVFNPSHQPTIPEYAAATMTPADVNSNASGQSSENTVLKSAEDQMRRLAAAGQDGSDEWNRLHELVTFYRSRGGV